MTQYRSKHAVIDAVQVTWKTWGEVCDFLNQHGGGNLLAMQGGATLITADEASDTCGEQSQAADGADYISFKVPTMHGETAVVRHGDWLIPDGAPATFYPCKPSAFANRWEPNVQVPAGTPGRRLAGLYAHFTREQLEVHLAEVEQHLDRYQDLETAATDYEQLSDRDLTMRLRAAEDTLRVYGQTPASSIQRDATPEDLACYELWNRWRDLAGPQTDDERRRLDADHVDELAREVRARQAQAAGSVTTVSADRGATADGQGATTDEPDPADLPTQSGDGRG